MRTPDRVRRALDAQAGNYAGLVAAEHTNHTVDALVLDLLEWIGPRPRPYAEVLEAWRTSCPRLPVWETAEERGFIARRPAPEGGARVAVSAAGAEHLRQHRRTPQRDT